MSHHSHTFHSFPEYLEYCLSYSQNGLIQQETNPKRVKEITRSARKTWKTHIQKHGNVPLILKCAVCSGAEFKVDVKAQRHCPHFLAREITAHEFPNPAIKQQ